MVRYASQVGLSLAPHSPTASARPRLHLKAAVTMRNRGCRDWGSCIRGKAGHAPSQLTLGECLAAQGFRILSPLFFSHPLPSLPIPFPPPLSTLPPTLLSFILRESALLPACSSSSPMLPSAPGPSTYSRISGGGGRGGRGGSGGGGGRRGGGREPFFCFLY